MLFVYFLCLNFTLCCENLCLNVPSVSCVVCSHLCIVNYTGGEAFVVKRALVFVTAIALYLVICIGVIVGISYFLVVFVDDRFHVVHTAVANFDVILVEKAVVFVLFREVLRNKIEKCSAAVSFDVFTERRVVPDDISLFFCVEVVQVVRFCCRSVFPCSRWLSKLSCRLVWPC